MHSEIFLLNNHFFSSHFLSHLYQQSVLYGEDIAGFNCDQIIVQDFLN